MPGKERYKTFEQDLASKIDRMFPEITSSHPKILNSYLFNTRSRVTRSLDLSKSNQKLIEDVLAIALYKASNREDKAFCHHGAEKHNTFYEAINRLIQGLKEGTYNFERSMSKKNSLKGDPEIAFVLVVPNDSISDAVAFFLDVQTAARKKAEIYEGWPWRPRGRFIAQTFNNKITTKLLSAYIRSKR